MSMEWDYKMSPEEVREYDIDISVSRYYKRGGRRYSKESAIAAIRECREEHFFKPSASWRGYERKLRIYSRFLTYELAGRIANASDGYDPIRVLFGFIQDMEKMMIEVDGIGGISFTNHMVLAAKDILEFME